MNTRWFIGLSCGSGGEAVDATLVETQGVGLNLAARHVQSVRRPLPREAQDLFHANPGPDLHRLIGETALAAAQHLLTQARIDAGRALAAGSLGPVQWHEPGGRRPATRELGMTALVADRLGLTVVSDFREQDVAGGGQGMPVSALADAVLFRAEADERLLIHLGGVSSVVHLAAGARVQGATAFEAGPCNRLLDAVVRQATGGRERFDPGGRYAVQGRCLDPLLEAWGQRLFFQQKPPKSLSRSAFGPEFVAEAVKAAAAAAGTFQDLLCTMSHFAVRCVVGAARRWLPPAPEGRTVYLSGGGVRNGMLWRLIEQHAPDWKLERLDALGVPFPSRNACAAAVLAALTLDGVPASTPAATGAVGRLLGRITPGDTANWGRCLRWMADQCGEVTLPYRAA